MLDCCSQQQYESVSILICVKIDRYTDRFTFNKRKQITENMRLWCLPESDKILFLKNNETSEKETNSKTTHGPKMKKKCGQKTNNDSRG